MKAEPPVPIPNPWGPFDPCESVFAFPIYWLAKIIVRWKRSR